MINLRLICGIFITQISLYSSVIAIQSHTSYTCDSPIYCDGPILKTVQLARIFSDSKTFVDMVKYHQLCTSKILTIVNSLLLNLKLKLLNLSINLVVQMLQKIK
jgi:alpha,alpha-trehalase